MLELMLCLAIGVFVVPIVVPWFVCLLLGLEAEGSRNDE